MMLFYFKLYQKLRKFVFSENLDKFCNLIKSLKMKPLFLKFALLILMFILNQQSIAALELSKNAQISLITGSPGTELYTLFGHSAIRVYDPFYGFDILYNYGTFDFNTPNFTLKFVQGRLNYALSKEYYQAFVEFYKREGRSIDEQVLDLTQVQKQKLFDFLEENYKPENRFYKYDFFFDNCSSRIRDVLIKVYKSDIVFENTTPKESKTFKALLDPYLKDAWLSLGIYLILGAPADKVASKSDYMYLPDYLNYAFADAKIKNGDEMIPLVKETKSVYQAIVTRPATYFFTPHLVFWVFLGVIAGITYLGYQRNKIAKGLDFFIFFLMGLVGCFFLFTWFGTDHQVLPMNFNMLWALPTHFIFAFYLWKGKLPNFVKIYFLISAFILIFTLVGWFFLPQRLHTAIIPIILVLLIRSIYRWAKS